MPILFFLLKLVAASGILLGYYWLALRNRNFHHYNRFYLLAAVATSLVMPFISIDFLIPAQEPTGKFLLQTFDMITVSDVAPESDAVALVSNGFFSSYTVWAALIYALGTMLVGLMFWRSLRYISRLREKYPRQQLQDLSFYQTTEPGTPFSFFRSIFWNQHISVNSAEGQQIFRHEMYHVKQQHSADLLFMELVILLAWFNPFYYLIRRELKVIHEFLADEHAASGGDEYAYAEILVLFALQEKQQQLVNPFFHHSIKRRITMLTSIKKQKMGYWGRIMALPLSLILFSFIVIKAKGLPASETGVVQTEDKPDRVHLQVQQDSLPKQKGEARVMTLTRPAKKSPGTTEWESWKDGKIYGVWLDGKQISNTKLSGYTPSQIAYYSVSKLSKNALNYGKHYYQVDLLTPDYYKKAFPKEKYEVTLVPPVKRKESASTLSDSLKRYIQRHLNKNLHYPEAALQQNHTASIRFTMNLDASGQLSDLKFMDGEVKGQDHLETWVVSMTRETGGTITPATGEHRQLFLDEVSRVIAKYQPPAGWNDAKSAGRIEFNIVYNLEETEAYKKKHQ